MSIGFPDELRLVRQRGNDFQHSRQVNGRLAAQVHDGAGSRLQRGTRLRRQGNRIERLAGELGEKIPCHQERGGFASRAIESATRWAREGGGPFVAASSQSISSTEENVRVVSCAPVCSTNSCFYSCRSFAGFGSIIQPDL